MLGIVKFDEINSRTFRMKQKGEKKYLLVRKRHFLHLSQAECF